jgi:hypothetical protein
MQIMIINKQKVAIGCKRFCFLYTFIVSVLRTRTHKTFNNYDDEIQYLLGDIAVFVSTTVVPIQSGGL